MNTQLQLTPAEWQLMECLWEAAPRTGRECVEYLQRSIGWSRSTTLTMLRRMTEKNMIRCMHQDDVMHYEPLIRREDAVQQETEHFLHRVYHDSVGLLMSAITQKQKLSKEEIKELYAILEQAEEGNAS